MREFNTAIDAEEGYDEESFGSEITTKIDGREVTFNGATTGQVAMLTAMSGAKLSESLGTMINFFFSLLQKEEDKMHFRQRLFNTEDKFGPHMIQQVVIGLIEEWSARPTQPESDSSDSPKPTGRNSTAKRHSRASTR